MDQGRQIRLELDSTFLPRLCGQSGSAVIVRFGLQSGQLSPSVGVAPEGKPLVTNNPARETGENRSQGSKSLDLRDLSDG